MPATNPAIQPFRDTQAAFDRDVARILRLASQDIARRLRMLDIKPGIGAQVRAAQLRLVQQQIDRRLAQMWGDVQATTQAGRKAAAKAAEAAAAVLQGVAHTALPPDAAKALSDGFAATAEAGIKAAYARVPRELSSRVYKNRALSNNLVHDRINIGLVNGLSARELAKDVSDLIDPNTPGGVSYAAMRLARTEINNAYHNQQREEAHRPGVKGTKWNLSRSHPKPDKCNVYADHPSPLGVGVFGVDDVPDKPHPHCFCFLTYITMDPADFAAALNAGDFDDELDRRTKANLARLGVGSNPEPVKVEPKRDKTMADHVKSGTRDEKELSQGAMGKTTMVTFNDGHKAVHKIMADGLIRDGKPQTDAEQLSSLVAQALGVRAPGVHRAGDNEIYMDFVDGLTGADVATTPNFRARRRAIETDEGGRIGIMDWLILNVDRHDGNYLIDDKGLPTAIDHGLAFNLRQGRSITRTRDDVLGRNEFLLVLGFPRFMDSPASLPPVPKLTPADIAWLRQRIVGLKDSFTKAGHGPGSDQDWWTIMEVQLDVLAGSATGTGKGLFTNG